MQILLRLPNRSIPFPNCQHLQQLHFRYHANRTQSLNICPSGHTLLNFEIFLVILVLIYKQVNKRLFVYFEHLYLNLILRFILLFEHLLYRSKYIPGHPRNDTHARGIWEVSEHRVSLTTPSLAIGHDGGVVALQSVTNNIFWSEVEDVELSRRKGENFVELEFETLRVARDVEVVFEGD